MKFKANIKGENMPALFGVVEKRADEIAQIITHSYRNNEGKETRALEEIFKKVKIKNETELAWVGYVIGCEHARSGSRGNNDSLVKAALLAALLR